MTNEISTIEKSSQRIVEDRLRKISTAIPGVIESYDPDSKTAKCSVNISDFIKGDGSELVENEWPPLEETPVWFPGGSVFAELFPLKAGDPCLLIFCQRDIAEWFLSNGKEPVSPADTEIFNKSSAICLPRLFPEGANEGEAHADNWISWFGNGKKRVVEPNGKKVSYVVDRFDVGSDGASNPAAKGNESQSNFDALAAKMNEIIAIVALPLPPGQLTPIGAMQNVKSDKSFVSS